MKWTYCDCGCKTSIVNVGSKTFSLLNHLNGNYTLYDGHGPDKTEVGKFTSTKAASLALLPLAKEEQANLERQLRALKTLIEEIGPG